MTPGKARAARILAIALILIYLPLGCLATWPQASHAEQAKAKHSTAVQMRAALIGWGHPTVADVLEQGSSVSGYQGETEVDTKFSFVDYDGSTKEAWRYVPDASYITPGAQVLLWRYGPSSQYQADDDPTYDGYFVTSLKNPTTPLTLYSPYQTYSDDIFMSMVGSWFAPEAWWASLVFVLLIAVVVVTFIFTTPDRRRKPLDQALAPSEPARQ